MLIAFSVTEQSQWKFICIGLYTPGLNDDKSDIILKHFEAVRDMRVSDESRISVGRGVRNPRGRKFRGRYSILRLPGLRGKGPPPWPPSWNRP